MIEKMEEGLQEAREEVVLFTPGLGKLSVNQMPVGALEGIRLEQLSEMDKIQCARDFFQTGNLSAIARERGIKYNDLLDMARQPWWQEEVKSLEREANALLKVKLTNILSSTLDALENRLEDGDLKWYGKGLQRVPVSARDLAIIGTAIFEKKAALEAADKGWGGNEAKKLQGLAEALRSKGFVPQEGPILEGEVVEDEFEPGTSMIGEIHNREEDRNDTTE